MTSLFHKFIEVAASKPHQADSIIQFAYMEQEIRKNYKQVKTTKGVQKPNDDFVDYWKQIGNLGRQEQMAVYFRWIELLEKSLNNYSIPELPDKEGQLYIKKSLISKWQPRKVKLNRYTMQIFSKKLRQFPLKCFCIRKSKNKDHFSWVMEVVMQVDQKDKIKNFHLGTNNIGQYQEWYREVQRRIDLARIEHFHGTISSDNVIQLPPNKNLKNKLSMLKTNKTVPRSDMRSARMKTITQLAIDKQMKQIEDDIGAPIFQETEKQNKETAQVHPNIFVRIFPNKDIQKFCQTPVNGELIECQKQYRLYEIDGVIKIFVTLNRSLDVVFRAISESHKNWNPEINVFNIKNKISSQNSIFVYQKDKPKGLLYRERDFFYLRHCFSLGTEDKKDKLFMIEKSIDSIHNPPFMTVARGQKDLIWCVNGNKQQKESLLVVQGLIRGGGYMNAAEDKENTVKYFKKLLQLDNYLKEIQLAKHSKDGYLFIQDWMISFKEEDEPHMEEDDEFYSPREIGSDEFKSNHPEQLTKRQDETVFLSPMKDEAQFNEFMKQTSENKIQQIKQSVSDPVMVSESFVEQYKPPKLNKDNSVIIPQNYIKKKHQVQPSAKGKQQFVEPFRGHHLWKGQWAISQTGGLNYVDQEKMKQQRGVLTFIIKRIGKNILSGKGILNVSLPVDIFCRQSNIERQAMSFGYCPLYLEKVINAEPIQQLKAILCSVMGSSLIYLTMEKPFNPILGQTYQCWIDGCPVYFQQISHHPPIASYLMIGRGYKLYGTMEAKMDISINSGTGMNQGIFTVQFDSGRLFHFTTAPGQLSGLTYGERKLCLVDKTYFWSMDEGLFLQLTYNPLSKQSRFFGGGKSFVGEQRLADYFEGVVRKYKPEDLKEHLAPKKGSARKTMAIPKSLPPQQPLAQYGKVHGRWTKHIFYDQQKIFNVDQSVHLTYRDQKYPLPSHSNYREDIVYRRMNEYVLSQEWKQILEVRQRRDRKLREDYGKKKK